MRLDGPDDQPLGWAIWFSKSEGILFAVTYGLDLMLTDSIPKGDLVTKALKLHHPVYAIGGNVLVPAGTVLTDQVIADLTRASQNESFNFLKVMHHGSIETDLRRICDAPPYDRIFSHRSRTKSLFALMDKVELPAPLIDAIDFFKSNDPYTYRHMLIVFALSMLLARDSIGDSYDLLAVGQACTTHDMGKCCIPLAVLKKTTRLGQAERDYLEHHPAAGYVLSGYFFKDFQSPAAITARDHHERCDGSGYPRGIALNNRIVEIVAVCDVFDALIAERPYRPTAYDLRTALEEITDMAARGAISWDIAKALISNNRKERMPVQQCVISSEKRGKPPGDNLYQGVGSAEEDPDNPVGV
jgi:HD-GYP domain-containing protein (c-di-GMP phosphodiesterase class II)